MKLTKKLASVGATVLMATSLGIIAAPAAHATAPTPLDPTNWTVSCDSIVGTIKFATALTLSPATSDNTISVKAVTSGCTVPVTGNAATGDPGNCVNPSQKVTTGASGTTTNGSTAITLSGADAANSFRLGAGPNGQDGAAITSSATSGIGVGNTIVTVNSATSATLANPATASGTLLKFTITSAALGSQPCVNLAPAKLGGTLVSLAGHNQIRNTAADGVTTNASKNISSASADFIASDVGASISGTGIPSGATIASVTDTTHAVLSANATSSNTGVSFHIVRADSSGCLGLSGLSSGTSGANITQFKNNPKGVDNQTPLPKLLTVGSGNTNANVTSAITQTNGTQFTGDGWGASYGEFQIGTAFGTTVGSRSGDAFEGGENGASDQFDATTGQSSPAILAQCLGKGVKVINFGIGMVSFG